MLHLSGFAAVYVCALMLGQRPAAAPDRHPLLRRGHRLDRPDRAVRDARPAGLARPDRPAAGPGRPGRRPVPDPGRPPAVGAGLARSGSGCRPANRPSCPGPGCAARCRSCWPPSRWPQGVAGAEFLFDVVLVFVIVFTVLQAPTLPFVARRLGLTDDQSAREIDVEVAPAGQDLRRPAAGPDPAEVPAGRGRDRRAAAAREHGGLADHPRRAARSRPAEYERIKVGDELLVVTPEAVAGRDRGPAPRRRPRRPAGPLAYVAGRRA